MNAEAKDKRWLVVQTLYRHENDVSSFLKEKDIDHFIPMHFVERIDKEGNKRRVPVPVIHNYVFAEKSMDAADFKKMLQDCKVPAFLMRNKGDDEPCEISNREMAEFRLFCDPAFNQTVVFQETSEKELDATAIGKEVTVVHGPFAGTHGRLMRKKGKYWFVKSLAGISVMLRISRWYCKPTD